MFLKAVVYSKVMEVKLMMYDSNPNNARIMMKYNPFHSMNPIYGRERQFSKSISILRCNAQFPFRCQCKQSYINEQSLYVFFKYFNKLKNLIFNVFWNTKNNILKENLLFTFQKELQLTRKENQIIKTQTITTQSTLSMKVKTKSKPTSFLNANENVLSNQQENERN